MRELFGGPEWASEERVSDNPALVWFSLPASLLSEAGVKLGKDYPRPIVEHDVARKRALAALASMRGSLRR